MQSGAVLNRWALVDEATALNRSARLLAAAECSAGTLEDRLGCLQRIPASRVQETLAFHASVPTRTMEFPFVPLDNDGTFFHRPVHEAIKDGDVKDCPTIIGAVADEGTFWLTYSLNHSIFPFSPSRESQCLMDRAQYRTGVNVTFDGYFDGALRRAIADKYGSDAPEPGTGTYFRNAMGRIYDAFFFSCDVWAFAGEGLGREGRTAPSYHYLFDRRSPANAWPPWMGVMHGYEIEYFFGAPFASSTRGLYPPEEREFAAAAMRAWGNFARGLVPLQWWPQQPKIAVLGPPAEKVLERSEPVCSFWRELSCKSSTVSAASSPHSLISLPFFLFLLSRLLSR